MIVVLQRVARARVDVDARAVGRIGPGLCLLCCGVRGDRDEEVDWLADKVAALRVFASREAPGRVDRSLVEAGGGALVVPQFTLAADWRKGRRPSFTGAAPPAEGARIVTRFAARLAAAGVEPVAEGVFGATMAVELVNDGPFTMVVDSRAWPGHVR